MKKYNKNLAEDNRATYGKVSAEKSFTEHDDPDQKLIPFSDHAKAYHYGKQLVPVSEENEHILKLKKPKSPFKKEDDPDDIKVKDDSVEKQFKLLGFTDQSSVPRHHFMIGVDVILPVKGEKNERAFAAMIDTMIEGKKVVVAKIIERKGSDPKLVVLYPHVSKK